MYLIGEQSRWHTTSALLSAVLGQIDGRRNVDAILAALPHFPAAQIHYALSQLCSKDVLEVLREPRASPSPPQLVSSTFGCLRISSDNQAAMTMMQECLEAEGLHRLSSSQSSVGATLELILVADYLSDIAVQALDAAIARSGNCVLVKLAGERSYFGPHFGRQSELCPHCFRQALRTNRPLESFLHRSAGRPFGPPGPNELRCSQYAHDTAEAFARTVREMLAGGPDQQELRHVVEFGANGRGVHRADMHTCPACRVERRPDEAPPLGQAPQTLHSRAGGYRTTEPAALVAELSAVVSDLTGFVSSIGQLDTGTAIDGEVNRHVWAAAYPVLPRHPGAGIDSFHGTALGKGIDARQAEASALCEAIERVSAQYRTSIKPLRASLEALGASALHPNSIWLFSERQFTNRHSWNVLTDDERRHVPQRLRAKQETDWVPVWSLTETKSKWMPLDLCFANGPEPKIGRFDPNGCAAGATLEEAALQGFLELVERDCVAVWWYNQIRRPALDPLRDCETRLRRLAVTLEEQGWKSWLLDLRNDLEIPCFAALARAETDGRWCIGFGCHFEAAIAMERAMTELGQLFRANGRDGPPPWTQLDKVASDFLFPHGTASAVDAPIAGTTSLSGLLDWCTQHLSAHDVELLIFEQTHPDIRLPVVKMFAPGLRHFWPRFAPGRLYDVPVKMGWQKHPRSEDELNHTHLFL